MSTRTYGYKGEIIEPCERAAGEHRGRWIIRSYHGPTRMVLGDEFSPHYSTLAAAREAIDWRMREERAS